MKRKDKHRRQNINAGIENEREKGLWRECKRRWQNLLSKAKLTKSLIKDKLITCESLEVLLSSKQLCWSCFQSKFWAVEWSHWAEKDDFGIIICFSSHSKGCFWWPLPQSPGFVFLQIPESPWPRHRTQACPGCYKHQFKYSNIIKPLMQMYLIESNNLWCSNQI